MPTLTAVAFGRERTVSVRQTGYDNVVQDLAALKDAPDVVVLLPWNHRALGAGKRSLRERVDDELGRVQVTHDGDPALPLALHERAVHGIVGIVGRHGPVNLSAGQGEDNRIRVGTGNRRDSRRSRDRRRRRHRE